MKILIAAGGSGGHIFPAIALAKTLRDRNYPVSIKFVGNNKGLDRRIFERESFDYYLLSSNKLPYEATPSLIMFFIKLVFDFIRSFFILLSYRPRVVVGFGGYVSSPIIFASYILGIPRLVHEQNVVPGRANRFSFRLANKICVSFKETIKYLGRDSRKAVFTGNPIRLSIIRAGKQDGKSRMGLDESKFTILVIGGSQGSHFLNEAFLKALSGMNEKYKSSLQVIHITGAKDYEWIAKEYRSLGLENRIYSFIDRIEEAYSASDLVITRSGASAIFEVALFGRPMILVPYPFAMSHQAENAKVFSSKGAAIELDERKLSADIFRDCIMELVADRTRLSGMAEAANRLSVPDASRVLAEEVVGLIRMV